MNKLSKRVYMEQVKANELRIGNKVKCPLVEGRIATVEGILPGKMIIIDGAGTAENLFPVPLTPEILMENGFSSHKRSWSFNDSGFYSESFWYILDGVDEFRQPIYRHGFMIGKFKDGFYYQAGNYRTRGTSLQHLHQLQNLYFALTGTELSVNLEKVKV